MMEKPLAKERFILEMRLHQFGLLLVTKLYCVYKKTNNCVKISEVHDMSYLKKINKFHTNSSIINNGLILIF